jgi:rhodanese-related sulfurtransferase
MQQIELTQLQDWLAQHKEHYLLLDVREDFEHEHFNIGGINIPLGELAQNLDQLPKEQKIVVYCAKGVRSMIAIQRLRDKGYTQLFNVKGGINALQKD